MDFGWEHYHRLNIILLSAIGLWPYDNKIFIRIKVLVMSFSIFLASFGQLATFFTVDYTTMLLLQNVPLMFVGFGILLKYSSLLAASDSINRITENMNGDWKDLSSAEDIEIIKKYVKRGNFHTKAFAMFICSAGLCLGFIPLSSVFLDVIMPLNESRKHILPVMFEVFSDKQEYFLIVMFLFESVAVVGVLTYVATETLLIVYIQHACALFEVTSRRIKNLLCFTEARDSKKSTNMGIITQVVKIHSRAIRHCKALKEDFTQPYLILIVFAILGLSGHLFQCAQALRNHDTTQFYTSGVYCMGVLGYLLYLNFVAQRLLDSSAEIFNNLCDSDWYEFPTPTRKLLIFCMLNSVKPVALDLQNVYVPSYEGSSLILRMVMSYTAALYSLQ